MHGRDAFNKNCDNIFLKYMQKTEQIKSVFVFKLYR